MTRISAPAQHACTPSEGPTVAPRKPNVHPRKINMASWLAPYGTFGPTAYVAAAGAMAIAGGLGAWVALYGPVGAPANPRPGPLLAPDVL